MDRPPHVCPKPHPHQSSIQGEEGPRQTPRGRTVGGYACRGVPRGWPSRDVLEGLLVLEPTFEAFPILTPKASPCFWEVGPGTSPPPAQPASAEPSSWTRATVLQGGPVMFPVGPMTQPRAFSEPGRRLLPCQPARGRGLSQGPLGRGANQGRGLPGPIPAAQLCQAVHHSEH